MHQKKRPSEAIQAKGLKKSYYFYVIQVPLMFCTKKKDNAPITKLKKRQNTKRIVLMPTVYKKTVKKILHRFRSTFLIDGAL